MKSRFETYVEETLAEAVKPRREELQKRIKAEKAKIEARIAAIKEIAEEGLKALNAKIDAQAKKYGWSVRDGSDPVVEAGDISGNCHGRYMEIATNYCCHSGGREYVSGPAAEAARALKAFDEAVDKTALRLAVVKLDLKMKADEFDKAMAEAVAKLLGK